MAKPNKAARGSGATPASRAARDKRAENSEALADVDKVLRGEMTAEAFKAKWNI